MFLLSLPKSFGMRLVKTQDGSHTLYVPALKEHYHSTYGAITESKHVFIQSGLGHLMAGSEATILEIGFGTGLNALLTCLFTMEHPVAITYHALEKYPLDAGLVKKLNYASYLLSEPDPGSLFSRIHEVAWNTTVRLLPGFQLHKIHDDLITFQPCFPYDVIFFDAFAPGKQPEMWTRPVFEKLYQNLSSNGIITTYCVRGAVKRLLKAVGFEIEKLPGPPGKREILRGRKRVTGNR
jgi:tRNA U34 5-methylaminomethyl-2-thiouridine-forming methyltransferase MnmC